MCPRLVTDTRLVQQEAPEMTPKQERTREMQTQYFKTASDGRPDLELSGKSCVPSAPARSDQQQRASRNLGRETKTIWALRPKPRMSSEGNTIRLLAVFDKKL